MNPRIKSLETKLHKDGHGKQLEAVRPWIPSMQETADEAEKEGGRMTKPFRPMTLIKSDEARWTPKESKKDPSRRRKVTRGEDKGRAGIPRVRKQRRTEQKKEGYNAAVKKCICSRAGE